MRCPVCGQPLPAEDSAAGELTCPSCRARIIPDAGRETRPLRSGPTSSRRPDPVTTLFQPGIMLRSILDEADSATGPREPFDRVPGGDTDPPALPALPLKLDAEIYFLVLGAAPGGERIVLNRARTILGREGADFDLDDGAISPRHCQVDVMGREFFVRDLDSEAGTFLNGHRVRYSELLPGDELRLGDTVLVFRTSDDESGQRRVQT